MVQEKRERNKPNTKRFGNNFFGSGKNSSFCSRCSLCYLKYQKGISHYVLSFAQFSDKRGTWNERKNFVLKWNKILNHFLKAINLFITWSNGYFLSISFLSISLLSPPNKRHLFIPYSLSYWMNTMFKVEKLLLFDSSLTSVLFLFFIEVSSHTIWSLD